MSINNNLSESIKKGVFIAGWPLLATPSYEYNRLKMLTVSLFMSSIFLFASVYNIPGGSHQFIQYAEYLLSNDGIKGGLRGLGGRSIGFPILLILSGYIVTKSFVLLTLIQAVFAALMPLFVYEAFGKENKYLAFYASIFTCLSLTPYHWIKLIHHDQLYLFLLMLSFFFYSVYLKSNKEIYLYISLITFLFTGFTRPWGALLSIGFLVFVILFNRLKLRFFLISLLILVMFSSLHMYHRSKFISKVSSYTGEQLLFIPYMFSKRYGIKIDESVGDNTKRMRQEIKRIIANPTKYHSSQLSFFYKRQNGIGKHTSDTPESIVSDIFNNPSYNNFFVITSLLQNDDVLKKSMFELLKRHPVKISFIYLHNLKLFLFKPGISFNPTVDNDIGSQGVEFMPAVDLILKERENLWAAVMLNVYWPETKSKKEMETSALYFENIRQYLLTYFKMIYINYRLINLILWGLSLYGLLYSYFGDRRLFILSSLSISIIIYHALIVAISVHPIFRYHYNTIIFLIISGLIGLKYIFQRLQNTNLIKLSMSMPFTENPIFLKYFLVISSILVIFIYIIFSSVLAII